MLKGTIYLTYDINLCISNLNTCKTIIIADEPSNYNVPGGIGGSLLLPPYDALVATIDGDEQKFRYEYINYLSTNPTVNKFINIILHALIVGTNIIILLDKEGPKFDMVLKEFFAVVFGIYIGDGANQFQFDMHFFPGILSRLYADGNIDCKNFLLLIPEGYQFDPFILRKLCFDYNIPFINDYESGMFFNKQSKILKNGGLIHTVKRIG